jgi:hypothetical protein
MSIDRQERVESGEGGKEENMQGGRVDELN